MAKPLYSYCHGWTIDAKKGFCEVTCKRRERCRYFDIDFYRHHGHHLDDFEEMFPMEPCQYFIEREGAKREEPADGKADFFDFIKE